jgi:hypothetical protein
MDVDIEAPPAIGWIDPRSDLKDEGKKKVVDHSFKLNQDFDEPVYANLKVGKKAYKLVEGGLVK